MKSKINCIFAIRNIINERLLILYSSDYNQTKNKHNFYMRNKKHSNRKLLNDLKIFSISSFEIFILEEFSSDLDWEPIKQQYMDKYNSVKHGYNIHPKAKTPLGNILTKQTREKIRISMLNVKNHSGHFSKRDPRVANGFEKLKKSYKIISPVGEVFIIKGLKQFCRDRNINFDGIKHLTDKTRKKDNYRGWKLEGL